MSTETPTPTVPDTLEVTTTIKLDEPQRKMAQSLAKPWSEGTSKSELMRRCLKEGFNAGQTAAILSAVTGGQVKTQFVYSVGKNAGLIKPKQSSQ